MVGWYVKRKTVGAQICKPETSRKSIAYKKYRSESIDVRRGETVLRFIGRGWVGVGRSTVPCIKLGSRLTQEVLYTSGSRGCCLRRCRGSSQKSLLETLSVTPRILG